MLFLPDHIKILKIVKSQIRKIFFQVWNRFSILDIYFCPFFKSQLFFPEKTLIFQLWPCWSQLFQWFSAYGNKCFQSQPTIWQGSATDYQRKAHFWLFPFVSMITHTTIRAKLIWLCLFLWSGAFSNILATKKHFGSCPYFE